MANPVAPYLNLIRQASAKYSVPADLLAAQLRQESGFNPRAVSPAGAEGIAQFMPGTAKGFGIDPFNPAQAIDAQAKYVSRLKQQFGSWDLALAGYNAGAGNVEKYHGIPPFGETQNYVKAINAGRGAFPGLAERLAASPPATLPTAARRSPSASQPGGVGGSGAAQAAFLQSIIDQNAQLAGIPTLRVPISSPLAPGINVPLKSAAIPKNTPPEAHNIVGLAKQYLGTKYTWGGASPKTGFDCSGFAQYLYGKVGVRLPRTSEQQYTVGRPVPQQALKAGDLVFFKGTDGPANDVGHEGIYIGNGKFAHAPHTGDVVKISDLNSSYYQAHYAGARRVA